jgi:SAM-dependent methyltransferase
MPSLSLLDFVGLFGTTPDLLPDSCLQAIAKGNWAYRVLEGVERDAVIIDLLKRIETRQLTLVKDEDKSRWDRGWDENLQAFKQSGGKLEALIPKYLRPGLPVRLHRQFVRAEDPEFETNWYLIFREWFVRHHLKDFDHIFEFGSGSGFNVAFIAKQFPEARVTGLDWSMPAIDIVEALRTVRGLDTVGRQFDFFHPDNTIEMPRGSAVFTVGALEQTGTDWGGFLDFILAKKPECCFHIEPIQEWYDQDNSLVDYTAWKAHEVRNFWRGFPAKVAELEKAGRARILKTKRSEFGSLVLEGYSQFIWRPL